MNKGLDCRNGQVFMLVGFSHNCQQNLLIMRTQPPGNRNCGQCSTRLGAQGNVKASEEALAVVEEVAKRSQKGEDCTDVEVEYDSNVPLVSGDRGRRCLRP